MPNRFRPILLAWKIKNVFFRIGIVRKNPVRCACCNSKSIPKSGFLERNICRKIGINYLPFPFLLERAIKYMPFPSTSRTIRSSYANLEQNFSKKTKTFMHAIFFYTRKIQSYFSLLTDKATKMARIVIIFRLLRAKHQAEI